MSAVCPTTARLAHQLTVLLTAAGIDHGSFEAHLSDTRPLGAGRPATLTPALDRLDAAALGLVLRGEDLLPAPWMGPASVHVTGAVQWAGLCRLAARALPAAPAALPGTFTARVDLDGDHDPGWQPDQRGVRTAVARLRVCLGQDSDFIDAEACAGYLADLHDALRVYAAEVDLVDALHGITFTQAGGAA